MLLEQVISNYGLVIGSIVKAMHDLDPDVSFVYDPSTNFTSNVQSLRRYLHSYNIRKERKYPIFAFNTSSIRVSDVFGFQAIFPSKTLPIINPNGGETEFAELYGMFNGEVDFNFSFYTDKYELSSNFQVLWGVGQYFNSIYRVEVEIPEINQTFQYSLYWRRDLSKNMTIEISPNVYQAVTGYMLIRGPFMSFRTGSAYFIHRIIVRIRELRSNILLEEFEINKDNIPPKDDSNIDQPVPEPIIPIFDPNGLD